MSVLSFFLGTVCFFLDSALLYSILKDVEKVLVSIVIYICTLIGSCQLTISVHLRLDAN